MSSTESAWTRFVATPFLEPYNGDDENPYVSRLSRVIYQPKDAAADKLIQQDMLHAIHPNYIWRIESLLETLIELDKQYGCTLSPPDHMIKYMMTPYYLLNVWETLDDHLKIIDKEYDYIYHVDQVNPNHDGASVTIDEFRAAREQVASILRDIREYIRDILNPGTIQ